MNQKWRILSHPQIIVISPINSTISCMAMIIHAAGDAAKKFNRLPRMAMAYHCLVKPYIDTFPSVFDLQDGPIDQSSLLCPFTICERIMRGRIR
jgi:hypothetical protein